MAEGHTWHPTERAVVVTLTFKGEDADARAERVEAYAKRIGHNGLFTEEVEVASPSSQLGSSTEPNREDRTDVES